MSEEHDHDHMEHQTGRERGDPEPAPEEQAEHNHMEHHDTHDHGQPESTQGEAAEHGDHGTITEQLRSSMNTESRSRRKRSESPLTFKITPNMMRSTRVMQTIPVTKRCSVGGSGSAWRSPFRS